MKQWLKEREDEAAADGPPQASSTASGSNEGTTLTPTKQVDKKVNDKSSLDTMD